MKLANFVGSRKLDQVNEMTRILRYWYVGLFVIVALFGTIIYLFQTDAGFADWLSDPDRINFQIEVTGTSGITYSETCSSASKFSSSSGYEAKIKVPHTYQEHVHVVSCTFQNNGNPGTLSVKMYREGKLVSSESTSDPNGSISVHGE